MTYEKSSIQNFIEYFSSKIIGISSADTGLFDKYFSSFLFIGGSP